MKTAALRKLSTEELVERFATIALKQDEALLGNDTFRFNHLYGQMDDVRNELKSREGDQRRALLHLFKHSNAQVRLKAAVSTLAVAPEEARKMLEEIRQSREFPQAGDAGMTIRGLEDGTFKPT